MPINLSNYKENSRFQALFVGPSGGGKSGAASSFPGPYHELDSDNRIEGIVNMVKKGIVDGKDISYEPLPVMGGWEPVGRELDRLSMKKIAWKQAPMSNSFPYGTIGLGSLSGLDRIITQLTIQELGGQRLGKYGENGGLRLKAPGDIKAIGNGIHQVLDVLLDMPCNVIITAHVVDKWGRPLEELGTALTESETKGNEYRNSVVIGETLTLSPNIAETVLARFTNVFRFERTVKGREVKYFVSFAGDLAKNSYGIPTGDFDFTGKNFYEFFKEMRVKYGQS